MRPIERPLGAQAPRSLASAGDAKATAAQQLASAVATRIFALFINAPSRWVRSAARLRGRLLWSKQFTKRANVAADHDELRVEHVDNGRDRVPDRGAGVRHRAAGAAV